MARPSHFRNALQVSPERIAALDDADLTILSRELLCAEAYRCDAAVSEIRVNTDEKAKDDGCDGWSPKPVFENRWLGAVETCWQFKAGSSGEPARLRGEITKAIPKRTLAEGGRFVLVASGSTNGKKGEENRLKKLREEAQAAGLPTDKIEVIGSERLTIWCNQHPATAMRWAGRPDGLWTLEEWRRSKEHQVPWQGTAAIEKVIDDRRIDLDFRSGSIVHLHIQGPPGVGKSRLALELCRNAAWSGEVIYVRQAADVRLLELLDGAVSEQGCWLVIVADEVQGEQLRPLKDSVDRGQGNVRLITIGHSKTPDPERIPALSVVPLETEPLVAVIKGWHPGMPIEHAQFVARFADGYVRLAYLAANAIARNPKMNVRDLLDLDHIRAVLDRMLGDGNRRALHVVAALSHVGWYEDLQSEGKSIARHLGQDWNDVRNKVGEFHRLFGIVPRGGRYRYISPTSLGTYLAIEAWTVYPDLLKTLPSALPTDKARDSYYERLQTIASNPQAGAFARDELSFFFRIEDFIEERAVRRWSALSAADPISAARNFRRALETVDPEARKSVKNSARRAAVWMLVRLAWNPNAFHDSVIALGLLAEAENETWGNNATGEFLARFQIFLGGTAVPYVERLSALDELVAAGRPTLTRLVVRALSKVGDQHATRMGSDPIPGELPQPEWQPKPGPEHFKCFTEALERLQTIARTGSLEIRDDLIAGARNLAMLLRSKELRPFVINVFDAVRESYPDSREGLRRVIADILYREKKYWKKLSSEDLQAIENLHARYEDVSLPARLRQFVGQASWDRDDQIDLTPLASDLFQARPTLVAEWPWLTSGQASDAWRLGQALAAIDQNGELENILPALEGRGPDLRLICGYVQKRRELNGIQWFERWITEQLQRNPTDAPLLFEVTWRCGATIKMTRQLIEILRGQSLESYVVGQLAFGTWSDDLPSSVLVELIQTMADKGFHETAIAIVGHRLRAKPDEFSAWEDVALRLVTDPRLIRSREMSNYYWKEAAGQLIGRHPKRIASAILREHADRKVDTWFAEFSEASTILRQCLEHDPSGVWEALKDFLDSDYGALSFSIGFPRGLVDQLPTEEIWKWVSENPEKHAPIIARFMAKNLSKDDALASRLLGAYGDIETVGDTFFSEYVSGAWSGSAADHWNGLAARLDEVVTRTSFPKLKRWAVEAARSLREMAERDRRREEEQHLGRS